MNRFIRRMARARKNRGGQDFLPAILKFSQY
jgi:hypothetical protein